MNNLIEIRELAELLGYADQRSTQNWCKRNKVPLVRLGKKTYAVRHFIDRLIIEQLDQFVKAHYHNPEEVLNAISMNDTGRLSEAIRSPQVPKLQTRRPVKNSKAAEDFLKELRELS